MSNRITRAVRGNITDVDAAIIAVGWVNRCGAPLGCCRVSRVQYLARAPPRSTRRPEHLTAARRPNDGRRRAMPPHEPWGWGRRWQRRSVSQAPRPGVPQTTGACSLDNRAHVQRFAEREVRDRQASKRRGQSLARRAHGRATVGTTIEHEDSGRSVRRRGRRTRRPIRELFEVRWL